MVVTGAGGAFCAGGDLGSFEELHDARVYRHVSHRLSELMDAVERLEKPVVAAIDGVATGAGLALALACDWRVASPRARLLFREGRLNLVPTHGGRHAAGEAGRSRAREGGAAGRRRSRRRRGIPPRSRDGAHRRGCRRGRARAGAEDAPARPALVRRGQAPAAGRGRHRPHSTMLAESLAQTMLLATDDHREGLAAVRERREPEFTGALMATIVEVNGLTPTIGEDVWLAPTAVLVGDVRVGDRANIWFGAVLRGDYSHIDIGAGSSIQDNAVVHCAEDLPTVIGRDVLVGHGAHARGLRDRGARPDRDGRDRAAARARGRARDGGRRRSGRRGRRGRRRDARGGGARAREEAAFRVRACSGPTRRWTATRTSATSI